MTDKTEKTPDDQAHIRQHLVEEASRLIGPFSAREAATVEGHIMSVGGEIARQCGRDFGVLLLSEDEAARYPEAIFLPLRPLDDRPPIFLTFRALPDLEFAQRCEMQAHLDSLIGQVAARIAEQP